MPTLAELQRKIKTLEVKIDDLIINIKVNLYAITPKTLAKWADNTAEPFAQFKDTIVDWDILDPDTNKPMSVSEETFIQMPQVIIQKIDQALAEEFFGVSDPKKAKKK